jgi:ectoine hydroxylase-related dioxygenase (phytanoyl-CoA dioxygenase family)
MNSSETMKHDPLTFVQNGAQRFAGALGAADLAALEAALASLPPDKAGIRLTGIAALASILAVDGVIGAVAAAVLGAGARPVRAVLFDKTPRTNWQLGWHQDRTIAVRSKVETDGYGPWSVKAGLPHVAPPFALLAGMVTLRAHLDPVGADNAPLLVAPGSHRLGRIPEAEVVEAVARCGSAMCLAERGDIWLYSTPILHASDAAAIPTRRLVLQVDYAAVDLPAGLAWLGV